MFSFFKHKHRTFFDTFGSRQADSEGVGTILWHQSPATSFYRQISYRFQIVPASCERSLRVTNDS